MAGKKSLGEGGVVRVAYYIFSAICFFLIFMFAVTISTERIDAQLILTMIIAVMLLTFMIYTSQSLGALYRRLVEMTERKKLVYGGVLRLVYYLLSVICFFLIFLLAVTLSPKRIDAELIMTIIIGVLLLTLMISNSQMLRVLHKQIDDMAEKKGDTG